MSQTHVACACQRMNSACGACGTSRCLASGPFDAADALSHAGVLANSLAPRQFGDFDAELVNDRPVVLDVVRGSSGFGHVVVVSETLVITDNSATRNEVGVQNPASPANMTYEEWDDVAEDFAAPYQGRYTVRRVLFTT